MKNPLKVHRLYEIALGQLRHKARALGVTLKELAKGNEGATGALRRGTPGAFGFVSKPKQGAKTDRRGYETPGNSRQRRFARRHPQHFNKV